jgi:signal peptidase I
MDSTEPSNALRTTARVVLIVLAVAIAVCATLFRSYVVHGSAMEPALTSGTRVVARQLPLGLGGPPEAGDVAVVTSPADGTLIIKRVIGVPGDRIRIDGERVFLNGAAVTGTFSPCEDLVEEGACAAETIAGRTWTVAISAHYDEPRSMEEIVVPAGRYFLLGDHRDASNDSRNPAVGFVPADAFVGRVVLAFSGAAGSFSSPTPLP